MGELGLNKIFGAVLAVALAILGLKELSMIVFDGGGHHHSAEYDSQNAWAKKNFAYYTEIAETGGGADVIEEIYDLGLLLVGADIAKGERSFKSKCASCHSIEQGGANGTGPNLYNTMGLPKQSHAGFNYSGALNQTEGIWSWENMDAWLENPGRYARGTSMAFAGLKRDDERANVLAYLASYSPDAPPVPEPLPQEDVTDEAVEAAAENAVDGAQPVASVDGDTLDENPTLATGEIVTQDTNPGENVELIIEEIADDIETTLEGEGNDVIDAIPNPDGE